MSITNKEQSPNLLQRLEHFSSWFRTKRAVAVCLRYQRILLDIARRKQMTTGGVKTRSSSREYKPVNVEELNSAEQEIIRHMQGAAFKEEISKLKNKTAKRR